MYVAAILVVGSLQSVDKPRKREPLIRQMTSSDIEELVEIHTSSWSPEELSVKLGAESVRIFYTHVVNSPHAFGYVYESEGKICGYATGFYDYQAFNNALNKKERFRLGFILLKGLFAGEVGLADICNLLNDDRKLRNAKYPKHHLGALALANEYKGTPLGKEAIRGAIGAVLTELGNKGYPGCWGLCDALNMPMRKYLLKLGFEEVDTIDMVGKSVVLYEKTLEKE